MKEYPYCFIIGGTRCGTTALLNYLLDACADQLMAFIGTQEPYGQMGRFLDLMWSPEALKWHEEFEKKGIGKRKNLIYFSRFFIWNYPLAPEKFHRTFPNAKLIMMMRNPTDRALSLYIANKTAMARWETLSFEKAIERPFDEDNEIDIQIYNYKQGSYWLRHIKRWEEFYPRENMMLIHSESFFARPAQAMVNVQEFLGMKTFTIAKTYHKINAHRYPQKMKGDTREKLIEYFRPYNEELYDYLGVDLGWEKA